MDPAFPSMYSQQSIPCLQQITDAPKPAYNSFEICGLNFNPRQGLPSLLVPPVFPTEVTSSFSTFSGMLQTALISFDLKATVIFVKECNIKNWS
jgi:hypothetical protein